MQHQVIPRQFPSALMKRLALVTWLSIDLLVAFTPAATAGNLLTNPGFSSNLSGWTLYVDDPAATATAVWSSIDANASANSGSAQITISNSNGGCPIYLYQIVPISPETTYVLSGKIRAPLALDCPTLDCASTIDTAGPGIDGSNGAYLTVFPGAGGFSSATQTWTSPPSVWSVGILVLLCAPSGIRIPTLVANFDDIYFGVCDTSISPIGASVGAAGGPGSFAVTTGPTCAWTAVSLAPWITVTGGASGTGSRSVSYNIAANTTTTRVGRISTGGAMFKVTQAASATIDGGPVIKAITSVFASGSTSDTSNDANGDCAVAPVDVFYLINTIFANGPPIETCPAPQ